MAKDACASCHDPLLLQVEPDSEFEEDEEITDIPDDVELRCGCHYHWECFLEAYTITECPNCQKTISSMSSSGQQQVLCTVRNEGGEQKDFDILPSATEEAYLRTYPEERIGHAYLEFCRAGDVDAIVHLVRDNQDSDAEEEGEKLDVLRYQGPFEGIEGSGLHVAIRSNHEEAAWLLLALASALEWSQFPPAIMQAMATLGSKKSDRQGGQDIRTLKDEQGRTAMDVAHAVGGPWSEWVKSGRLAP